MSDEPITTDRPEPSRRRRRVVRVGLAAGVALVLAGVWTGTVIASDEPDDSGARPPVAQDSPSSEADAPGDRAHSEDPLAGAKAEANRPRRKPVPLTSPASASRVVSVELARLEWVQGKTVVPGEVGGDALRVTVSASNTGDSDVGLVAPVVNLYYGRDGKPSSFLLEPGSEPFPQAIPAGGSAEGVFVLTVPKDPDIRIRVEVDLDPELRIVSFVGRPRDLV